ncbi:hypothetical protein [Pseudomonas sp. H1_G08]|jgi:hypothetical protein
MAEEGSRSFSLEGLEKIIDSVANLFLVVWDKSEFLGYFVIVMTCFLPFWISYVWMVANKPERKIDKRIESSRKASKKRLKAKPGGKK